VSAARPKVADYPFTTLTPHLGVVGGEEWEYVLADVPGLISGAHEGQGLGHRFLRHLLRTRFLVYLVDASEASGRDPADDLKVLLNEVERYGHGLGTRPAVVVANKMDIVADPGRIAHLESACRALGYDLLRVSAATGEGTREMVNELARRLQEIPTEVEAGEGK
jgi:GTP-binding protein